ncbi:hypothetical protein GGR51DRAFT_576220 [Nemania sp. FL0031]|nr:hypothetical protein GGR51DRAFT_576220 [Nemania sp. FL0031]
MFHTPPPQTVPQSPLAVKTYKTLPDASKAGLPPKPLVTPTKSSTSQFHSPGTPAMPSPKRTPRSQKRTFSSSIQSVMVPWRTYPIIIGKGIKSTTTSGVSHNIIDKGNAKVEVEVESADRPAKIRRMSPRGNRSDDTNEVHQQPSGNSIPQTTESDAVRIEVQLIQNKLLGGATALSEGDQDYLRHQIDQESPYISPQVMRLLAMRVTNRNSSLSYNIMFWAHKKGEMKLLEYTLVDLLYFFDMNEAFDQGLMSVSEVSNLMDCQTVLHAIREQ